MNLTVPAAVAALETAFLDMLREGPAASAGSSRARGRSPLPVAPRTCPALALAVRKEFDGDLQDGQFAFRLLDAQRKPLQVVRNDASGEVAFGAIDYTLADAGTTFTHYVEEVDACGCACLLLDRRRRT